MNSILMKHLLSERKVRLLKMGKKKTSKNLKKSVHFNENLSLEVNLFCIQTQWSHIRVYLNYREVIYG